MTNNYQILCRKPLTNSFDPVIFGFSGFSSLLIYISSSITWRDGVFALTWADSTPLTGGNHIAFRTQSSSVRFDDIRATTTSSSLYYFFTDHLGSTSVLSDSSGNEVAGSRTRHLPFGGWRGTAPTQTVTDRAFTGQKENMEVGLLYYNARYYLPYINRFISADTIVPNPQNPQQFNRYSYVLNNPMRFNDPSGHACADASDHPSEEYDCYGQARIFFLNGTGLGENAIVLNPNPRSGQGYILYNLAKLFGQENVEHIPVFTNTTDTDQSLNEMFQEARGSSKPYSNYVANTIEASLEDNPLAPGEKLIIVGISGGGTIAIEALGILEEKSIFVDQVVLRGSFVDELWLNNVGQVDYIAADPPISDWQFYSLDVNPLDDVDVRQHIVEGLWGHNPGRNASLNSQISDIIINSIASVIDHN